MDMSLNRPSTTPDQKARLAQQRHSLLWRIHLWAALIASPFLIGAVLTGLLYIFTPQIEVILHGHLDRVPSVGRPYPLDDLAETAVASAPRGWRLHSIIPPHTKSESAKIAFVSPTSLQSMEGEARSQHPEGGQRTDSTHIAPSHRMSAEHGAHGAHGGAEQRDQINKASGFLKGSFGLPKNSLVVYVDPYKNKVLGSLVQSERFDVWARRLHSTYLTEGFRWIIELAASWTLVMLVTGIFLWKPSREIAVTSNKKPKGRARWRPWHAWTGVVLSLISTVILVTGLTWSKYAGGQVRIARDAIGQQSPRIPAHFKSGAPSNLVAAAAPTGGMPSTDMISWDHAWEAVRRNAPDVTIQLGAPESREGFWRANHIDRGDPTRRFDLLLDAYNGKPLFFSGWDDQPWFGKATAIGIPFHRGEFGMWNQILLGLFGVGLLASLVSGWAMFFTRRRQGLLGLPRLVPGAWSSASPWAYVGGAMMLSLMPLLALSSLGVAALEVMFFLKTKRSVQ